MRIYDRVVSNERDFVIALIFAVIGAVGLGRSKDGISGGCTAAKK
jgi:hypothetical protein